MERRWEWETRDSCAEAQEAQGVGDAIGSETRTESA